MPVCNKVFLKELNAFIDMEVISYFISETMTCLMTLKHSFRLRNLFLCTIVSGRYSERKSFCPLHHRPSDISRRRCYSITLVGAARWSSAGEIKGKGVFLDGKTWHVAPRACLRCWGFSRRPPCRSAGLQEPGLASPRWPQVGSSQPDIEALLPRWVHVEVFWTYGCLWHERTRHWLTDP